MAEIRKPIWPSYSLPASHSGASVSMAETETKKKPPEAMDVYIYIQKSIGGLGG
jgi:hypothetical protein